MAAKPQKTDKPKGKGKSPKTPSKKKAFRGPGRPAKPILTVAKVAAGLRRHVGNLTAVARSLRVDRTSVRQFLAARPELRAIADEASEVFVDLAEGSLLKAVRKCEGWAVCFTLKTRGRSRGYIENPDRLPPLELLFSLLGPVLGAQLRAMLIPPPLEEVNSNEPATVSPPVRVSDSAPAADGVPLPVPVPNPVRESLNGDGHGPGQGEDHSP